MKIEEFNQVLNKSLRIIQVGIEKGYFKEEDKETLIKKLLDVAKNGIVKDIQGTAIYGVYSSTQKRLYYNAKVFKDEKEALIYILHEMKHALDDNELSIGFDLKGEEKGVGMNEGATQRFATDIAEEILGEKISETMQSSLGITLSTNLDEYQIEDKMNELFCKALGISRAEFLRIQNENDLESMNALKQRFNEFADFDAFETALDGIYAIQEETWIDENGNLLEQEAEPMPEQTARAKELIRQCQEQVIQFVEKSNPAKLEEIKGELLIMSYEDFELDKLNQDIQYQEDYMQYQKFIMERFNFGEKAIVYISGTEPTVFSDESSNGITGKFNSGETITENIWLREKDEYKKVKVTFNRDGLTEVSEEETVTSLDGIIKEIDRSDTLGNPEEYIRILELQGEEEKAREARQRYEYFLNNRDRYFEEVKRNKEQSRGAKEELAKESEFILGSNYRIEDGRIIFPGEELDEEESPKIQPDEGEISYNGIIIFSDGLWINRFGIITELTEIPQEIIDNIEQAVENGELTLNDAQRNTLLMIKQNNKETTITPDMAAKNALKGTTEDKSNEATRIEEATLNPEKAQEQK